MLSWRLCNCARHDNSFHLIYRKLSLIYVEHNFAVNCTQPKAINHGFSFSRFWLKFNLRENGHHLNAPIDTYVVQYIARA